MTSLRVLLGALAVLCGMVPAAVSADGSGDGSGDGMLFRIHDERVVESSGLALSRTHPGLAYTVNDSGDEARVLVLSMRDGSVVGETVLTGATADDFEALAPAPGGRLVVGDIGDNDADRDSVEAYVVPEPGTGTAQVRPRTVSLTYSGGPRDAEAMVVVHKALYVVSKGVFGGAVFTAPLLTSEATEMDLRRVAAAPPVVTDAALLADGDVAMRSYSRGYVGSPTDWRVHTTYPLPRVPQGETVAAALHGRRIFVGSEGPDSPIYEVTVPRTTSDARSERPDGPDRISIDPAPTPRPQEQDEPGPRARPSGYVVAVAVALVAGYLLRRRRRRGRRPPIHIR